MQTRPGTRLRARPKRACKVARKHRAPLCCSLSLTITAHHTRLPSSLNMPPRRNSKAAASAAPAAKRGRPSASKGKQRVVDSDSDVS